MRYINVLEIFKFRYGSAERTVMAYWEFNVML